VRLLHARSQFTGSYGDLQPGDSSEQPLVDRHQPAFEQLRQGNVMSIVCLRPPKFVGDLPCSLRRRSSIVLARGLAISPRQAISCSAELASVTMSCGARSLCPRRLAKPTGVWHAATATNASTTRSFVNGHCVSDGVQRPN
jgi:hypothetical protein